MLLVYNHRETIRTYLLKARESIDTRNKSRESTHQHRTIYYERNGNTIIICSIASEWTDERRNTCFHDKPYFAI